MKRIVTLLICVSSFYPAFAKHIIGGGFTYRCLDNGNYEFTLKVYRDCAGGGAPFDDLANIAVYLGDNQVPVLEYEASLQQIIDIDPLDQSNDPCINIPPGICVQEGSYTFILNLPGWPSTESYHIVYQRCCRNESISNILNPGDVGATFTIEITPASQTVCNNSPTFNNFPPIVLCNNIPLDFSHSASDEEGDQIIYELCPPLLGGGLAGSPSDPTGDPTSCEGVFPSPPCPPPFDLPNYVPPYTAFDPMPANPPLSIDALTGKLSGTPNQTGQYIVAICAKEYRNGELLSLIRREFQFNVVACEVNTLASFDLPLQNEPNHYLLESCERQAQAINTSIWTPGQDVLLWQLQVNDSLYQFNTPDFNWTFPEYGSYEAVFYINPGSAICSDTAWLDIIVHPEIYPKFSFSYDSCIAGPVSFLDSSFTEAGQEITAWNWSFGDSLSSSEQHPFHEYYEPGDFEVQLLIQDENDCTNTISKTIAYYPAPAVIVISPGEDFGCIGQALFFENQSHPLDESYTLEWDFGDGSTDSTISPYHTYWQKGIYDIYLSIVSPWDCFIDTVFPALVEVFESPQAGFTYSPPEPSNFESEIQFTDTTSLASHWLWYINDLNTPLFNQPNPSYTFPDTGLQIVQLIVVSENGCRDTLQKIVDVVPKYTFFMPNAFTPNFDRLNDFFQPTGIFFGLKDYKLQIWDRYGELVFSSEDFRQGWNGSMLNNGQVLPPGTYLYHLSFTEPRGKKVSKEGHVLLLR